MENEILNYWTKCATTGYVSMQELSTIQFKAVEAVIAQQQALMSAIVDACSAQVKLAADAGSYKDVLAGQAKLISEQGDKFLSISRATTGTLETLKGDISNWVEKGIETTREVATPTSLIKPFAVKRAA